MEALKNKTENYPRKYFWTQEKETQVKFIPGLSANRPSKNWGKGCYVQGFYIKGFYIQGYYIQGSYVQWSNILEFDVKGFYIQGLLHELILHPLDSYVQRYYGQPTFRDLVFVDILAKLSDRSFLCMVTNMACLYNVL